MTLSEQEVFPQNDLAGPERHVLDRLKGKCSYLTQENQMLVKNTAFYLIHKFADAKVSDRDSGRPKSCHSIDTAAILADMHLPVAALQMGLLHDVVEDASHQDETEAAANLAEIREKFGSEIADGVDKLGIIKKYGDDSPPGVIDDETRDQKLRKNFFEAIINNPLVALVRLAERWQNLEEIGPRYGKYPESAIRTCEETIAVYAPAAWEMGLYEMANEMAHYSLLTLCPDGMGKLPQRLPAFSDREVKKVAGYLEKRFGIPGEKYRVFPPSYYQLARTADEKRIKRRRRKEIIQELAHRDWEQGLERITPEKAPILADVLVATDDELGTYADRIIRNSLFYKHDRTLRGYLADREEGGKRAYYLQIAAKVIRRTTLSPVRIALMFDEEWRYRTASLVHLYQMGTPIDNALVSAAGRRKVELDERLKRLQAGESNLPRRGDIYVAEMHGNLMPVTVLINGEKKSIYVDKKSTALDIAVQALTSEDFLCCQSISVNKRPIDIRQRVPVSSDSEVRIKIHPGNLWQVRPSWFSALRKAPEEIRAEMIEALRTVIDGRYAPGDTPDLLRWTRRYRQEVAHEAKARGVEIVRTAYKNRLRTEKKLRVAKGFDESLKAKYGDDAERFYQDAGIEAVPFEQINALVDRLGMIRDNLLPVKVNIPKGFQDRPGWEGVVTSVLEKLGFSIVESSAGESDEKGIGATLTYFVEAVNPMAEAELRRAKGKIIKAIRKRCADKFKGAPKPKILFKP